MGHIKEPDGVDLIIGPSILTDSDKEKITAVISYYKRTGKILTEKRNREKFVRVVENNLRLNK